MNKEWMLWLACGVLAAAALLRMMRRRQLALIGLLKSYVDRQVQWNRRRTKAAAIMAADEAKQASQNAQTAQNTARDAIA